LSTIARQELAPYSEKDATSLRINGPQVLLEPNAAQVVAVTLHELATNAAKYGALSVPNGQISLTWTHNADGRLVLHWTETGGPAVKTPTHRGFGTRIIERMIDQQRGKARFDWHADGLVCEIILQA
jgi:two-component sensor histidine kinase